MSTKLQWRPKETDRGLAWEASTTSESGARVELLVEWGVWPDVYIWYVLLGNSITTSRVVMGQETDLEVAKSAAHLALATLGDWLNSVWISY